MLRTVEHRRRRRTQPRHDHATSGRSRPAVRAVAEHLPIGTDAVDASIALLTVHHWSDVDAGIAEMIRVARRRVVILTWDDTVFRQFWLLRVFARRRRDRRASGCADHQTGFAAGHGVDPAGARTARLCRRIRRSLLAPTASLPRRDRASRDLDARADAEPLLREGLSRLDADLATGAWTDRHADLLDVPQLDLGYRLLVSDFDCP